MKKLFARSIYLDNAATTRFKPHAGIRAVTRELARSANGGRGSHADSLRAATVVEECRLRASSLTGKKQIVFTKNCTEAINLALFGMDLSGEVVTSVLEHNSVLRPLAELSARGKITLRFVAPNAKGVITADAVARVIKKNTSLVALSEMSNVTGAAHEIPAIASLCAGQNIKLLVDTAQSLGHLRTDYKGVTFVCASGHKGLLGPQGTGFLATDGAVSLSPLMFGGTGSFSAEKAQPRHFPEGYEAGTLNTPGIAGLSEGIKYIQKNDDYPILCDMVKDVHNSVKTVKRVTIYSSSEPHSSIFSFNIGDMPSSAVADILNTKYRIAVRAGLHCAPKLHEYYGTLRQGIVRASFGACNTEKDVHMLIHAIITLAKGK